VSVASAIAYIGLAIRILDHARELLSALPVVPPSGGSGAGPAQPDGIAPDLGTTSASLSNVPQGLRDEIERAAIEEAGRFQQG
jgi:hypothetical protein